MSEHDALTLSTLARGALEELWQAELERALDNVADVNAPARKPRTITLTIALHPDEGREVAALEVSARSKLPPPTSATSMLHLYRRGGRALALEHDPRQLQFELDEQTRPRAIRAGEEDEDDGR
jgi:hypothetical protein